MTPITTTDLIASGMPHWLGETLLGVVLAAVLIAHFAMNALCVNR